MTASVLAPSLLDAAGVDPDRAREILGDALAGADDGELFLERSESEAFVFDDGRLKTASYDSGEGFGLRVVAGETAGYAHSSEISEAAIRRASTSRSPSSGTAAARPALPAPAAAPASKPGSRPTSGRARSTRRCARRWSISTRSTARPARWT